MKKAILGLALVLGMSQAFADDSCVMNAIAVGDQSQTASQESVLVTLSADALSYDVKDYTLSAINYNQAGVRKSYTLRDASQLSASAKAHGATLTTVKAGAVSLGMLRSDNGDAAIYVLSKSADLDAALPTAMLSAKSPSFSRTVDVSGTTDKVVINISCVHGK